ncbi:putative outer membrane adhesin like protein, partial [Actinobacillus minor NM305]
MSIKVKIHSQNQSTVTKQVKNNEKLVIEHPKLANTSFELVDEKTGLAPQSIVTKRKGKDLEITVEGSETANIVIKNYYDDEGAKSPITGIAEDGHLYAYIPESGLQADVIPALQDGVLSSSVLGGNLESVAAVYDAVMPNWGWWLIGAGLLGGILAAAGGGSGGGNGGSSSNTTNNGGTTNNG